MSLTILRCPAGAELPVETRDTIFSSGLADPAKWLLEALGVISTASTTGVSVNERNATRYAPVHRAVSLLSRTLASLPLKVFRTLERGRELAVTHPLYPVLHDRPNPEMTSFAFREQLMRDALLYPGAFAEIILDGSGRVRQLWRIDPSAVEPKRVGPNQDLVFIVRTQTGEVPLLPSRVLQIPGIVGADGRPVIRDAKQAIALGIAAETFGALFFGRGANPALKITHPSKLSEKAAQNLRESVDRLYGGLGNAHRAMILEEGMDADPITMEPEKAQFLQTRQHQVGDIARFWDVPPHLLYDLARATFSNIEHQSLEFIIYTLLPWISVWEQEMNFKLFLPEERGVFFTKFIFDAVLRGDAKSRADANRILWMHGVITTNEWRELEERNPVEGGDEPFVPLNMAPLSRAGDLAGSTSAPPSDKPPTEENPRAAPPSASLRLLRGVAERIVRREAIELSRCLRSTKPENILQRAAEFYAGDFQALFLREAEPVLRSLLELDGAADISDDTFSAPLIAIARASAASAQERFRRWIEKNQPATIRTLLDDYQQTEPSALAENLASILREGIAGLGDPV